MEIYLQNYADYFRFSDCVFFHKAHTDTHKTFGGPHIPKQLLTSENL